MVSEKAGKETKVVGSNLIYSTNRLAQVWANQKGSDKLTTKARNFTWFMHVVHKARNFTWFMPIEIVYKILGFQIWNPILLSHFVTCSTILCQPEVNRSCYMLAMTMSHKITRACLVVRLGYLGFSN